MLCTVPVGGNPPEDYRITLSRIAWMLPHVHLSDKHRMGILDVVSKDKAATLPHRSCDFYEYSLLPATPKIIWTVKTTSQLEKPRYLVIGFQINRKSWE